MLGAIYDSATNKITAPVDVEAQRVGPLLRVLAETSGSQIPALSQQREEALQLLGRALHMPDPQASSNTLREALAKDPTLGAAYLALAERNPSETRTLLEQAQTNRAEPLAIADLQLRLAAVERDPQLEIKALRSLVEQLPDNTAVRSRLAYTAWRLRDFSAAASAFAAIVKQEPGNYEAVKMHAYALAWSGDYAAADKVLADLRRIGSNNPDTFDSAAEIAFRARRFAESAKLYEQAYRLNPQFQGGLTLHRAALAKLAAGDQEGAQRLEAEFEKAAVANPFTRYLAATFRDLRGEASLEPALASGPGDAAAALLSLHVALNQLRSGAVAPARERLRTLAPLVQTPLARPYIWLQLAASGLNGQALQRAAATFTQNAAEQKAYAGMALAVRRNYAEAARLLQEGLPLSGWDVGMPDAVAAWAAAKARQQPVPGGLPVNAGDELAYALIAADLR